MMYESKKFLGLKFIFEDGDEFELDVVPGRERPNHGDYNDDNTDLSLYINPSNRSQKEKDGDRTRIKTNIRKHIDLLAGPGRIHERNIVKLLKVWKTHKKDKDGGNLIKSFIMELYTKEAFDSCDSIPNGLWPKTKMVMQYIVDNIIDKNLIDPANSDNIVSDSMSDSDKSDTKKSMMDTIDDIERDSDLIKDHFPINSKYDQSDEKESNTSYPSNATVLGVNKFG